MLSRTAKRLKTIREARGLSQRIVYIDTDINIGKLELGRTNITISTLHLLCNYYGLTVHEFFDSKP